MTVALGVLFLGFQGYEFGHAYADLNLTLGSGVYGSTFFMLTGFHGMHVTVGAIMLLVMLIRSMRGHFTPEHHFAFEAAAWYWHFVDCGVDRVVHLRLLALIERRQAGTARTSPGHPGGPTSAGTEGATARPSRPVRIRGEFRAVG